MTVSFILSLLKQTVAYLQLVGRDRVKALTSEIVVKPDESGSNPSIMGIHQYNGCVQEEAQLTLDITEALHLQVLNDPAVRKRYL